MSIFGVGIDIININRINRLFSLYSIKFAKRILSNTEFSILHKQKNKSRFLAKRFATKEAIVKAFGIGFQKGINFSQFEIYNNSLGKPKIRCFHKAFMLYKNLKIKKIHVTITDEKNYVCSFVILEN